MNTTAQTKTEITAQAAAALVAAVEQALDQIDGAENPEAYLLAEIALGEAQFAADCIDGTTDQDEALAYLEATTAAAQVAQLALQATTDPAALDKAQAAAQAAGLA